MQIFHIAEPEAWLARTEFYITEDFDSEGFIHCSTQEQLNGVLSRFYADRNDLMLLTVDPAKLTSPLVFEDLYDAGEEFPHVYGPISLKAIVDAAPFDLTSDPLT